MKLQAFGAVETLADRFCIASKSATKVVLSPGTRTATPDLRLICMQSTSLDVISLITVAVVAISSMLGTSWLHKAQFLKSVSHTLLEPALYSHVPIHAAERMAPSSTSSAYREPLPHF